jgi:hypothetical protein
VEGFGKGVLYLRWILLMEVGHKQSYDIADTKCDINGQQKNGKLFLEKTSLNVN